MWWSQWGLNPCLTLERLSKLKKINWMSHRTHPVSDKDLQRDTKCVSDIGQASARRSLPARRNHITQKLKVAGQCTLYLRVHDDEQPAEILLRVKGADCSSELIRLYDVIARPMSISLQHGAPPEKLRDLFMVSKLTSGSSRKNQNLWRRRRGRKFLR